MNETEKEYIRLFIIEKNDGKIFLDYQDSY